MDNSNPFKFLSAFEIQNPKLKRQLRFLFILFLGFTSGLPLALTGQTMQAWLTIEKIEVATIGFFSLVGLPYTFKFLWAPLMDRFEVPFLGRRRGWIILTQLFVALMLIVLSTIGPATNTQLFALIALSVAFFSASQDIVIDAYRTDILDPDQRGLASSLTILGYRLAMILSGGIAFIWADPAGRNMPWSEIYVVMAKLMIAAAVLCFLFLPKVKLDNIAPNTNAKNELIGFFALVIVAVVGYQFTNLAATPLMQQILGPWFSTEDAKMAANFKKWVDLLALYLGIAFTIPLAWYVSKKTKFETLNLSLKNYFSNQGAVAFLVLIILYKVGDAFAGALTTNFLINGAQFTQAEVGVVNKVFGMWCTIFGAIFGGAIMIRIGLYRSLLIFGILQLLSNFGFWQLAISGRDVWGSFSIPAFDWIIVSLKDPSQVDYLLLFAVSFENITGGMGTAALLALLMALCNQKFSATQFAFLSSLASTGRVWVGPLAGVLVTSIGWPTFFVFSVLAAVPGIAMLVKMSQQVKLLEAPKNVSLADD